MAELASTEGLADCTKLEPAAHPTLEELQLKTLAETEWFGSGVGVAFPSLSA